MAAVMLAIPSQVSANSVTAPIPALCGSPLALTCERWVATYNHGEASYTGDGPDTAAAVDVSPDGESVFVTGKSGWSMATAAYEADTGAERWVSRHRTDWGGGAGLSAGYDLGVSPDGSRVFVTGENINQATGSDIATIAYDATTGQQLWLAEYWHEGREIDRPVALVVSPDGTRVYVTGESRDVATSSDYATIAYDAGTGARLWAARYNTPGGRTQDTPLDLALSPDGSRLFVTGWSGTVAYVAHDPEHPDHEGERLWLALPRLAPFDITPSPDGSRVYLTGAAALMQLDSDYATVALDAEDGAELWRSTYDGPAQSRDIATEIAASPDGSRVYVSGASVGLIDGTGMGTYFDYATLAYTADTGTQVWETRYDGLGHSVDSPFDVGLSPDGSRLFVTGQNWLNYTSTYVTFAYDTATGDERWMARYDAPGYTLDDPVDLAVSPAGDRVYVAGTSSDLMRPANWATVAYDDV
jgi:DNA-binding beta-propeller fold protein YncE